MYLDLGIDNAVCSEVSHHQPETRFTESRAVEFFSRADGKNTRRFV